jgi:hypothetical protein
MIFGILALNQIYLQIYYKSPASSQNKDLNKNVCYRIKLRVDFRQGAIKKWKIKEI